MPGLDGLRAVSVLGVVAYHLNFSWAAGGLLGVGVFFTLSGYLITDLLLEDAARGGLRLGAFWRARARRLLPALFGVLAVVLIWVTIVGPRQPPELRPAVVTAIGYVNNWWLIFHDVSYFDNFAAPLPLNHLWSLSIEEQFYILWPLLLALGLAYLAGGRLSLQGRLRLAGATGALALASAAAMALLFEPGIDPSRVYYGTDTRAFELLAGAALAMVWPSRRLRADIAPAAATTLTAVGGVGLVAILLMFWRADQFSPFLYRGGFVLLSLATVLALAALVHPASRLGPVLGWRPLRWIGERSYGIYLWHFPIIVLTSPEATQRPDVARAAAQLAATIVVAALSWRYVEDPIRRGGLAVLRGWRWSPRRRWAGVAVASAFALTALVGFAGAGVDDAKRRSPGRVEVSRTVNAATTKPVSRRTVCREVIHIGDSTSEGLISPDYLPKARHRISARYADVGATTQHLEVSGARSIYERYQGLPNANDVALGYRQRGFRGCWVLALGTNETANVAAGSKEGLAKRIETMMTTIGTQPVLWVNVRSRRPTGPYANENMRAWNDALVDACDSHPNMRIYDWASDVKNDWFIPDGIHFTTPGYRARAALIAQALLQAFPREGPQAPGCVVRARRG